MIGVWVEGIDGFWVVGPKSGVAPRGLRKRLRNEVR